MVQEYVRIYNLRIWQLLTELICSAETGTQRSGACLPILVKEIAKIRENNTVMLNTLKALGENLDRSKWSRSMLLAEATQLIKSTLLKTIEEFAIFETSLEYDQDQFNSVVYLKFLYFHCLLHF